MPPHLLVLVLHLLLPKASVVNSFAFNGFHGANLTLDGTATITLDGLLRLTNGTKMLKSHAFFPSPIRFRTSPTSGVLSFSTTFAFGILHDTELSGHGVVLAISRSTDFSSATTSQYLGLFNASNNMNSTNHVVGVELDTILNPELGDINDNHVGIDVNGLISINSSAAGYFSDDGEFRNLSLISGDAMQLWVDYDGEATRMDVNLARLGEPKPRIPLLSTVVDLSSVIEETMFVGFSATTDPFQTSHYILGWSYNTSGEAKLDTSFLPSLPATHHSKRRPTRIWLPIVIALVVMAATGVAVLYVVRRIKFSEVVEDWEKQYGPHRFPYKTLFDATGGFAPSGLLGSGGFGSVYRGSLRGPGTHIAVKRISHESRQGIREFVAEIASLGRVRHRNLVPLLGYCRRKSELMLVYEYMPNGSLDKHLFSTTATPPTWQQRLRVIKGVALGLLYLHEEWEQVVIHRDVKSSNVLLDGDLNGRLGDFGLARLYDHGSDPHTTNVVGTRGYLAPELSRTSRATKATDVFAFGTFVLEVVTGRRPVELSLKEEEEEVVVLVDWVLDAWRRGAVTEVVDGRMGGGWEEGEVEMVVLVGLVCSHPVSEARPGAREVVRVLEGEVELPGVAKQLLDFAELERLQGDAFAGMDVAVGFSYSASFATGMLVSADDGANRSAQLSPSDANPTNGSGAAIRSQR